MVGSGATLSHSIGEIHSIFFHLQWSDGGGGVVGRESGSKVAFLSPVQNTQV